MILLRNDKTVVLAVFHLARPNVLNPTAADIRAMDAGLTLQFENVLNTVMPQFGLQPADVQTKSTVLLLAQFSNGLTPVVKVSQACQLLVNGQATIASG